MKETAITTRDRQRTATESSASQPITNDPTVAGLTEPDVIEPEEPDLDADEPGVSADPVRNYLNEIGRTALLDASALRDPAAAL